MARDSELPNALFTLPVCDIRSAALERLLVPLAAGSLSFDSGHDDEWIARFSSASGAYEERSR